VPLRHRNTETEKMYAEYYEDTTITQKMFSSLINGYDFGMSIIYNNDADMKVLESAIYFSKFSKKI